MKEPQGSIKKQGAFISGTKLTKKERPHCHNRNGHLGTVLFVNKSIFNKI